MARKLVWIFLLLTCTAFNALAQGYEVPSNYVLKTDADYERYEADVIKTADWLQQASWTTQAKKIEAANQFLLKWAKGSAVVTVKLTEALMNLSDKNPQLGFVYIAQYCKYALLHKTDLDPTAANAIALRSLMAKYTAEPGHRRDDDVEQLITLDKKGELNDWIAAAFYSE